MKSNRTYIQSLLEAYLRDELDETKEGALLDLLQSEEHFSVVEEMVDRLLRAETLPGPSMREQRLMEIERHILSRGTQVREEARRMWPTWGKVAASVVLLILAGLGVWYVSHLDQPSEKYAQYGQLVEAPDRNRAVLSVDESQHVYLDSIPSRVLGVQEAILVEKVKDGEIIYHHQHTIPSSPPVLHTLNNPRRSKPVQVTLGDGTKVTLNAGTTIRYLVPFDKVRREIQIEGEAYFEVAHNSAWPMLVRYRDLHVEVLGTSFNVNAYEDAQEAVVALVEGAVRVDLKENASSLQSAHLRPGYQAVWHTAQQSVSTSEANLRQVLAWREGRFDFENKRFDEAMQELARWYDIEVVYTDQIPQIVFFGDLNRNTTLNGLLRTLEIFGVKARIEDQKLYLEFKSR